MADSFELDPNDTRVFTIVWCDSDGTNDGGSTDDGDLQGATISDSTAIVSTSLGYVSDNTNATTIRGTSYGINTVHNITLNVNSTGVVGEKVPVISRITPSAGAGGGTWDKTITIVIKEN
jgi:hypothetical protein